MKPPLANESTTNRPTYDGQTTDEPTTYTPTSIIGPTSPTSYPKTQSPTEEEVGGYLPEDRRGKVENEMMHIAD